jgi:hypothetical protein
MRRFRDVSLHICDFDDLSNGSAGVLNALNTAVARGTCEERRFLQAKIEKSDIHQWINVSFHH